MSASPGLSKALSQRQLRMIAIGGVIGAGLFVGSGVVMGDTGPVLTVRSFTDDDDALRQANDTAYGLAASAWTRDVYRAQRASREIHSGCVWINDHIPIISEMPHGGVGSSGFGKDMSDYSFEEYLTIKHVMSDITGVADKDWYRTIFTKR